MGRNRKVSKKLSVAAGRSLQIGGILFVLFVMVVLNCLATSRCSQMKQRNGDQERKLERLEAQRVRESARWEEMKSPDKLEAVLLKHGLSMHYPRAEQVVRMRKDGKPYPGQLSIARIKNYGVQATPARNTRSRR